MLVGHEGVIIEILIVVVGTLGLVSDVAFRRACAWISQEKA